MFLGILLALLGLLLASPASVMASGATNTNSLEFLPFGLQPGISRQATERIMGRPADDGPDRWRLSGEIRYKLFSPQDLLVILEPDKQENDEYIAAVWKKADAAQSAEEKNRILSSPHFFKSDKVTGVNLIQPVENCEDLRRVFPDAYAFVKKKFSPKLKEQGHADLLKAFDCLGGDYDFTFSVGKGNTIQVQAMDNYDFGKKSDQPEFYIFVLFRPRRASGKTTN